MHTLKPFGLQKVNFTLDGDVSINGPEIQIEFSLFDKEGLFLLPEQAFKLGPDLQRLDGLWNQTCFEAFLSPVGMAQYYEFNFSLTPAWNLYGFERNRYPQPPVMSEDFKLKSFDWNAFEAKLIVTLSNHTRYQKFRIGLSAVLAEKNGNKHFCALAHTRQTPDFHAADSFTLLKG